MDVRVFAELRESDNALGEWLVANHKKDIDKGVKQAIRRNEQAIATKHPDEYRGHVIQQCVCVKSTRDKILKKIESDEPLGAYVKGVAFNVATDALRAQTPKQRHDVDDIESLPEFVTACWDVMYEEARAERREKDRQEIADAVQAAHAKLPREMHRVLHDRLIEPRSFRGIATKWTKGREKATTKGERPPITEAYVTSLFDKALRRLEEDLEFLKR